MEEEEVVVVVVVVVVFRFDDKECFGGGMATVSMCDCMTKRSLSLSGKKKIHPTGKILRARVCGTRKKYNSRRLSSLR